MEARLPGLVGLSARNPGPMTGDGNHTWLLTGAVPTLVDAGVGRPEHLDAIAEVLEAAGQTLAQVLVTHGHPDHASGAPALAGRWPNASIRKWPWPEVDGRYPAPWAPLAADELVPAGDLALRVVHTPGHAPDHVCLWEAESRTLFGGDILIQDGTVVVPGTRGGDLTAYLDSLARVAALAPLQVLPAHGPVIEDPLGLIERYSAHRASRERDVVAAIRGGADTVDAVLAAVYPTVRGPLRLVARETVQAHLNKLRREQRLSDRDGRLTLTA
jgi:glyoxylase-like metal-dependent hydrolase (beta-lactamase superfamily II)